MAQLGATCTVCNHRDVKLINAAINNKQATRRIAASFGVGKDAVSRHTRGRHDGVIWDEPGVETRDDATPRENLEAVIELLKKKLTNGTIRTDEIRELRISLQELDKLQGGDKPEVTTVRDLDGYAELEAAMFAALEPFPEARQALAAALRERLK